MAESETARAAGVPAPLRSAGACAAVLALAVVAVYARTLGGAFLYDDVDAIGANASLKTLSTAFSPPLGTTASGRPLLNAGLALSHLAGGGSVWAYHLGNIAIHLAASLLLLGLLRRTLARLGWEAEALPIAFSASLLWAVHPLQTESVAYMVQRAESQMGCLVLLCLYGFARRSEGGRAAPYWGLLSWAACLAAMATKEVASVAPVLVLLYEVTLLGGTWGASLRRSRVLYGAYAACWLPLGYWVATTGGRGGTAGFHSAVAWWDYLLTQFTAVIHYVRLAVWPEPLVGDYGWILARDPVEIAFCGALVASLAAATALAVRDRRPWGYLGAWFLVILAPSSSIVPVSTEIIAEHRMYLPLAAVTTVAALAGARYLGARRLVQSALVLGAVLALVAFVRTRAYDNSEAFWQDVVEKVPTNAGAWNNLGNVYLEKGERHGAMEAYLRALAIVPTYAYAHYNLANALAASGKVEEAISHYEQALAYRPDDPSIHYNLGNALEQQKRWLAAASQYREALRLDPARTDARFNLGDAMVRAGNLPEAEAAYAAVVEARPGFADARVNLGNVLAEEGKLGPAVYQLREALRIDPSSADVHNNLGSALARMGRLPEARDAFAEALRLRPDYAEARENLGRVRALLGAGP